MTSYFEWRERQTNCQTRAGIRHDDGPVPEDYARRQDNERWATFWIGVGLVLSSPFWLPFLERATQ